MLKFVTEVYNGLKIISGKSSCFNMANVFADKAKQTKALSSPARC